MTRSHTWGWNSAPASPSDPPIGGSPYRPPGSGRYALVRADENHSQVVVRVALARAGHGPHLALEKCNARRPRAHRRIPNRNRRASWPIPRKNKASPRQRWHPVPPRTASTMRSGSATRARSRWRWARMARCAVHTRRAAPVPVRRTERAVRNRRGVPDRALPFARVGDCPPQRP